MHTSSGPALPDAYRTTVANPLSAAQPARNRCELEDGLMAIRNGRMSTSIGGKQIDNRPMQVCRAPMQVCTSPVSIDIRPMSGYRRVMSIDITPMRICSRVM